jgi:hydroxymethylbilane synthase
VKEVQEAILENKADLAVHSMKDLPVEATSGLRVAAVLPRAHPSDTLIFSPALLTSILAPSTALYSTAPEQVLQALASLNWSTLAPIGTTSARRQAFLRETLPNCSANLTVLRGNVDSRLKRVAANEFTFIMLARAGIDRLGLYNESVMMTLPHSMSVPAPAQGIVAIECRETDSQLRNALKSINNQMAALEAAYERAVLWFTGSGCHTALASHFRNGLLTAWVADKTFKQSINFQLNEAELHEWQTYAKSQDYSELFSSLLQSSCGQRLYSVLESNNFASIVTMRQYPHS